MKKLWVIICASLLFAACGGGAGTSKPALAVKLDGKDVPVEVKSS